MEGAMFGIVRQIPGVHAWRKFKYIWNNIWNKKSVAVDNVYETNGHHYVGSSGGERSIRAGVGALVAIDHAGLGDLETSGGVSGGIIPAILHKAVGARQMLRLSLDIDSMELLTKHRGVIATLFSCVKHARIEKTRPRHGLWHSANLGALIDKHVPVWPKGCWTLAVDKKDNVILFDDSGVKEISPDGQITVISDTPVSPGLAIQATCAATCAITAVEVLDRLLFDGDHNPDGPCPVAIPKRHYGATDARIIACDVGDDNSPSATRRLKLLRLLAGKRYFPIQQFNTLTDRDGMVVIEPASHFSSFLFTLTRDQKWIAVMHAYIATVEALKQSGKMIGKALADAEEIVAAYRRIEDVWRTAEPGLLSARTEELMASYGLY
jgi:hypothetical protein